MSIIVYMTIDRFWELLSKKNCGEISPAETKELEEILVVHPEWNSAAETLSNLNFQSTVFADNYEAEQAFETHLNRMKKADIEFGDVESSAVEMQTPKAGGNSKKWFAAFAIMAGGVALFLGLRNTLVSSEKNNRRQSTLSQVSTKPGSRTQIQLPDGSVVRLNSSSSLTYDKNFGKNIREVSLTGEAFFDVTKDSSHPFIIHTNVIDIKVLGTAFNVKSYPNDANTETSLIRGKVEVTVKNRANERIYLEPNEKLVVANNSGSSVNKSSAYQAEQRNNKTDLSSKPIYAVQHLTLNPVDSTIVETSWVDNRLVFQENETFKEVALRMERWYGVQMNFASEKVAGYRPFASFKNETITQALDELKLGFKFNYKIEGNIITVTE